MWWIKAEDIHHPLPSNSDLGAAVASQMGRTDPNVASNHLARHASGI
jgi:hypothetical protein